MIVFNDVNISHENTPLLEGISFRIKKGQKAVLKGRSGSGKSSIMKTILGFHLPQKGEIFIKDIALKAGNEKLIREFTSWVPQDIWTPLERVKDFLLYPFSFKINHHLYPDTKAIGEMLDQLMLPVSLLEKPVKQISGGEKQRIALCSSLLLKKDIILWDEPTSALDDYTKEHICSFIMQQPELTLLVSSHDAYWIEASDIIIKTEEYHVA